MFLDLAVPPTPHLTLRGTGGKGRGRDLSLRRTDVGLRVVAVYYCITVFQRDRE